VISKEVISGLLSDIAQGRESFTTLSSNHGYHWRIEVNGYEIVIFDDAGECDYVEWAVSPEGEKTTFDEWWNASQPLWPVTADSPALDSGREEEVRFSKLFKPTDPIDLLSVSDHLALEWIMNTELEAQARLG
jgi:hypothetical protein